MSERAAELGGYLEAFHNRLVTFVEGLDDADLDTVMPATGLSVRTLAAQLSGPRFYGITLIITTFLEGGEFPDFEAEDLVDAGKAYLKAHSGWEKQKILDALHSEGPAAVGRVAALTDDDLARTMKLKRFGNEITLAQAIDWLIIGASVDALEEMRRSVFSKTSLD